MTPLEFAEKWVPRSRNGVQPGEHKFKTQAAREISRAIGGKPAAETIRRSWGSDFSEYPHWVPRMLELEDMRREIEAQVSRGTPRPHD